LAGEKMNFKTWTETKLRKLDWIDLGLIKLSCLVFGILLAVLIPALTTIKTWLLVVVVVLLAIKPLLKVLG